jgi:hypothetical protein
VIEPDDKTSYAYDRDIVVDLGGEEAAESPMADFWDQIALQGRGQAGQLNVDGRANIGYAKGANGVLRTVLAFWYSVGWNFNAHGFPYAHRWYAGDLVVAPRNS